MSKKQAGKYRLSPREIEKFRVLLLAKRAEILGDVVWMENETLRKEKSDLSNVPLHMADIGTDNYEVEHTLGLMESETKVLAEIDAALDRIENGTYGICQADDEPIPKARLGAIPWTRYCVGCAGALEKGAQVRPESYKKSHFRPVNDDDSYQSLKAGDEDFDADDKEM